ncbi:phage portal protein [Schumannella soli]|uniref:Phage portal protein n=1 Tax=Schumannella soli TaxID=2590779 RepID=A0A506Y1P7_9MICO|nr:phage portal protein [Schumannella soli]TPW75892.1 phage portal protein [Schumannella soli]
MGILDRLGLSPSRLENLSTTIELGVRSPWISGEDKLTTLTVAKALFPDGKTPDSFPLTREEALSIPAVSRARNLLVSTIARFPLRALSSSGVLAADQQPSFLYRTNGVDSPYERMAATVDDCIFDGRALWLVDRGAGESPKGGPILDATWLPLNKWTITDGHVMVDEKPLPEADYILFNIPRFAGLLAVGDRTLRGARDTEQAWVARMRNPIPATELRVTDESRLDEGEIEEFVAAWRAAFTAAEAAVGYTPEGVEMVTHGAGDAPELFIESRNAIRTDVGSFLNLRPSMIDGTSGIDSLTYTTKGEERNAFFDFDLPFWTDPIEAALSGDNVVPRGQRVRFDRYEQYGVPIATGVPVED